MLEAITNKFHPSVFRCSPMFHAVIAYILGQVWTKPSLRTLSITSDGFVVSEQNFIGSVEDLERNLGGASAAAELTDAEAVFFYELYRSKVDDWRNRV